MGIDVKAFWSRTAADGDCIVWTGTRDRDGYGVFHRSSRARQAAHRLAYELVKGPIPPGLEIDHLCARRDCVNPAHLEAVTHAENLRRGRSFSALNAAKTHCPHGHEYTPENTYLNPRPKYINRVCRTCKRNGSRANSAA